MKTRHILATVITALSTIPLASFGQSSRAVPLLEINPDARSAAMGGNQYGESRVMQLYSNATSLLYDPHLWSASFATQLYQKPEDSHIGRQKYYAVMAARRLDKHAVQIGFRYLGGLDIPMTDNSSLKPADYTIDLGYAYRIDDHFSVAGSASLVHSKVVEEATTVAFNVAAYYRNSFGTEMPTNYVIGISGNNMGPDLDYGKKYKKNNLPASFGGGGEISTGFSLNHKLSLSATAQYFCMPENASMFTFNTGIEYGFADMVFIRGGYRYAEHDYSSFAIGAGLDASIIRIDATYQKGIGGNDTHQWLIALGVSF